MVWDKENTPEQIVIDCEKKIPVLIENGEKNVLNGEINNLLIEGDNFHSLTCLNMAGISNIDIIYIDPPYNTGVKDFSYNDKFVEKEDGFRHSKWLSFMKKRLELSRSLLSENGAIFISIDDHELYNLKLLCDSVFGEKNFIGNIIWKSNPNGRGDSQYLGTLFEYVLCYRKSPLTKFKYAPQQLDQFNLKDEKGPYAEQILHSKLSYSIGMDYPIKAPDGTFVYAGSVTKDEWEKRKSDKSVKKAMTWRFGEAKFKEEFEKGEVVFRKVKNVWKVYRKRRPTEGGSAPYKNFYDLEGTRHGSNQIKEIFNGTPFDHPKPVGLIKYLVSLVDIENPLVLDFFAGSGTTGQAVMELNQEDGGQRKFILCTNNENNICADVCYPRIKAVITGKRKDGSKYSDGIHENLIYFTTNFVNDSPNRDQAKYSLVDKCNGLLCILEDCYHQEIVSSSWFKYSSKFKNLYIYKDFYSSEEFEKLKIDISKSSNPCVLYIFSTDENLDFIDQSGLKNTILKPIPSKIYEIYKEIVEQIKRGE